MRFPVLVLATETEISSTASVLSGEWPRHHIFTVAANKRRSSVKSWALLKKT
jgi:hypothetical protein